VGDSLVGRVVRERQLIVVEDIASQKPEFHPNYPARDWRRPVCSAAGVSIRDRRSYISCVSGAFTEEETRFAGAVAGRLPWRSRTPV
jgi:hypothetical protein